MNALGQLLLYATVGLSYFLLFVMTAPLFARVFLKIYFTGYWYPLIYLLTLTLMVAFHSRVVSKYINFDSQINVGRALLINIGKAAVLLVLTLIFVQILFLTGMHEGRLF